MASPESILSKESAGSSRLDCAERCCFYSALIVWLIWKIVQTSMFAIPNGSKFNTVIHFLLLGVFAISCLRHIKLDTNFFMAIVLGLIGVLVKVFADSFTYVDLAIIFYASQRFDFKDTAKVALITVATACAFILICSQLGAIQDYPFTRGSKIRHGLGFLYTTFLSHYYLNIVLLYVFLRPRPKIVEIIVLLLIDIAIFVATDSRNSFLLVILILAFVILAPSLKKITGVRLNKFFRNFVGWSFVLFAVLCLVLPVVFDSSNSTWKSLDSVSSHRLSQTQASLNKYGVTAFGQDIEINGNGLYASNEGIITASEHNPSGDTNYVDSSFMQILIYDGAVVWVFLLAVATAASLRISKKDSALLCVITLLIVVHAAVDDLFIDLQYDTFLLLFWGYAAASIQEGRIWKTLCTHVPFLSANPKPLFRREQTPTKSDIEIK